MKTDYRSIGPATWMVVIWSKVKRVLVWKGEGVHVQCIWLSKLRHAMRSRDRDGNSRSVCVWGGGGGICMVDKAETSDPKLCM